MAAECVVNLILTAAKLPNDTVRCIPNPAWMVQWALLAQQNIYSAAKLSRCLYALCRIEAAMSPQTSVVGKDTRSKSVQTVLFTIPMAVVPVLLPVLHDIFPDDRHVFAYTGCIQTVSAAATLGTINSARQNKIATANSRSSLKQALQFEHAAAFTTPINAAMVKPVSSCTSRIAHSCQDSLNSKCPPGRASSVAPGPVPLRRPA